jgi:flavin reductase (DIM6/NTAB) family NADH-FMN oxidoreductase RutF
MVKEFPWNMECKVVKRIELGSHVCYLGEVLATHSEEIYVSNGRLDPEKFNCFAYLNGNYIGLERGVLETHGFSV